MIHFVCSECGDELTLIKANQYGYDASMKMEPCGCSSATEEAYNALNEECADAYNKIDELKERLEDGYRDYKELVEESKELKWKQKHDDLEHKFNGVSGMLSLVNTESKEQKERIVELNEAIEQTIKNHYQDKDQLISNHNLAMDGVDLRYKELQLEHKKLIFQFDKLRSEANGGKYNRSVDL